MLKIHFQLITKLLISLQRGYRYSLILVIIDNVKCIITFLIAEIFKYVLDLTSKLAMRQRGLQLSLKNGNITPITMFFYKLIQKVFAMLSV